MDEDLKKRAVDAIKAGADVAKMLGRRHLGAKQVAFLLQVFAAAMVVMGFFCYGLFGAIAQINSRSLEHITFKGWAWSFCTGLAIGAVFSALAEIIKLLIRIDTNIENQKSAHDGM